MANSKSDKPHVRNVIIGCVIAILVFHLAWTKQYTQNLDNWLFTAIDFALIGAFIAEAISAYKHADDPNKEWKRYVLIGIAVVLCFWAGGWAAGINERVGL